MSDFFNEAYRLARSRFTTEHWLALPPQQVTEAIYQAMREIDAATAGKVSIHPRVKPPKGVRNAERAEPRHTEDEGPAL
jgi:hypothetical protein